MKRLLPVLIAVTLIVAVFCLLPKSEQSHKLLEKLDDLNGCKVGIQTGLNYENYLARSCPEAEPVFFSEYRSMFPALQQGKAGRDAHRKHKLYSRKGGIQWTGRH